MTLYKSEYTEADPDPGMEQHQQLIRDISKLIGGTNPAVMGGVIVELAAKFVAGHNPKLRKQVFEATMEAVKDLVPVCAMELMAHSGGAVKDWAGGVDDAPAEATPTSARPESSE